MTQLSDPWEDHQPATTVERLKESVEHLIEDIRYEVALGLREGREELESLTERRRGKAAEGVTAVADVLRESAAGSELRDRPYLADLAESWADRIDETAAYVRSRPAREVASDLKRFARRRPGLFLAATFISGVAVARFLKSSGARARETAISDPVGASPSMPVAEHVAVPEFDVVAIRAGVS
jgi:hypothetical protein